MVLDFPESLPDNLPRGCSRVGLPWDACLVKRVL